SAASLALLDDPAGVVSPLGVTWSIWAVTWRQGGHRRADRRRCRGGGAHPPGSRQPAQRLRRRGGRGGAGAGAGVPRRRQCPTCVATPAAEARAHGFHVDEVSGVVLDPAVPDPDPAVADDRVRHREELTEADREGLRAADHADAELAQVLPMAASASSTAATGRWPRPWSPAGRRPGATCCRCPPRCTGRGLRLVAEPARGERRRLIEEQPQLIGNTNGIPLARRDEANRRYLPLAERSCWTSGARAAGAPPSDGC
ncbi:hypothetical protein, partial [Nocardioides alcanivorans]|uniref:hypothetical protein n=1 Tax=Nocardioides alcanivorans TaxID=2897352 RepID=UPI001F363D6C